MLTGFKKLFKAGQSTGTASVAEPPNPSAPATSSLPRPTAREDFSANRNTQNSGTMLTISLKNIIGRFPEVLKGAVQQTPSDAAAIQLPSTLITEQLSKGRVHITFGKLKELSPEGIFQNATDQDSMLVDLPLQEIISQLKNSSVGKSKPAPAMSKTDGKSNNSPISASTPSRPAGSASNSPKSPPPPFIKPPTLSSLKNQNLPSRSASSKSFSPEPLPGRAAHKSGPAHRKPSTLEGSLSVPLNQIQSKWPDKILDEIKNLPNSSELKVEFPLNQIDPAIQQGKIQFPWSQIRGWLRPAVEQAVSEHDAAELEVPLQVVVPLFLQHQKPVTKNTIIDELEDIPELFGVDAPASEPDKTAANSTTGTAPSPAQASSATPANSSRDSGESRILPMSKEGEGLKLRDDSESNAIPMPPQKEEPSIPMLSGKSSTLPSTSAPSPDPNSFRPPAVKPPAAAPLTLGRVFLQPEKTKWTIQEIVDKTTLMAGVSGALVAMDDGLLVAAKLPDAGDQDTIAAFLPRIFQRMTEACEAMGLGQSNQLTMKFEDNPVVMIKSGKCFLLVFGNAEYPLPMVQIEVIARHLEKHA